MYLRPSNTETAQYPQTHWWKRLTLLIVQRLFKALLVCSLLEFKLFVLWWTWKTLCSSLGSVPSSFFSPNAQHVLVTLSLLVMFSSLLIIITAALQIHFSWSPSSIAVSKIRALLMSKQNRRISPHILEATLLSIVKLVFMFCNIQHDYRSIPVRQLFLSHVNMG